MQGPPSPPDWVASIPLIGSHIADYWNYLNESSSVRLQELARLLPAAKTIAIWGGGALAAGIFQISFELADCVLFLSRRTSRGESTPRRASSDRRGERRSSSRSRGRDDSRSRLRCSWNRTSAGRSRRYRLRYRGVPGAVSLGFVTFVLSFMPGGPLIVAAPAAFWLYRQGSIAWAVFMMVWGLMVGMLDNVVKPLLISRGGSTPMILVMLGVLGGALAFGVIGMFLGPTLVALGYSLFEQWAVSASEVRQA